MGQPLAKLLLATTLLGGCSKLYDPDNLPKATDAPRPPPDIMPCEMEITDLAPATLFEGTGAGGSRQAALVIEGKNLVKVNMSVDIVVAGTTTKPMIDFNNSAIEVDAYGEFLALPLTLPVTPGPAAVVPLDVTVTQDCNGSALKSQPLTGKLTLTGLDELVMAPTGFVADIREYSQIRIPPGATITTGSAATPVVLRSRSSVEIGAAISVNAVMQNGGPGGGRGGNGGGADLLNPGPGMAGEGPTPGQPSGGAGGFSTTDVALSTLKAPNRGSGGAGGQGGTTAAGGNGGGGGGSIEITAAGDLTVAAISASGGAATSGANPGGGGSGGVILLRAGRNLTLTGTLDVAGSGAGASGLTRYDAGGTITGSLTGHYRGPMFVDPPVITRSKAPEITISGKPLSSFRYFIIRESDSSVLVDETIGVGGTARGALQEDLGPGLNQLCLVVVGGTPSSDTRNCIDIAFLPDR